MEFLKKKEYILWDNDGVLVDTERWFYEANRRLLEEHDIHMDINSYMLLMRKGGSALSFLEKAGMDSEALIQEREKRNTYYRDFLLTEDIEIEGVLETLDFLSKQFRMAIVTTSRRDHFDNIHGKRAITDYMEFILSIEDYPRAKPFPDPYLKGLSLFDASPEQAVVIEDSERGLHSAIAAGIDCIIVRNNFTKSHDFSGAALIVDTISDLRKVLSPQ